jgi:hypothetical protein
VKLKKMAPSAAAAASMLALAVPGTSSARTTGDSEHAPTPAPAEAAHVTTMTVDGKTLTVQSSVPVEITNVRKAPGARNPNSWYGDLKICASGGSEIGCNTNLWWAKDSFGFTTDVNTNQAWNNGTPTCQANHTDITWCSYVNNGKSTFQEGFDFGANGWARMDIYGNTPSFCGFRGPYWAGYEEGINTSIYDGAQVTCQSDPGGN